MATDVQAPTPATQVPPTNPAALNELSALLGERQLRLFLAGLARRLRDAAPDAEVATFLRKTPTGFRAEFRTTERVW